MKIRDQVAVVVGCAKGIGRAIVESFAAEGCPVAMFDVDDSVHQVAAAVQREFSVETLAAQVDATDYAAVGEQAARAHRELGRCDHVVYAAGLGSGKFGFPFWNLEPADWERVLHVNLMGAVHIAHAFSPLLVRARRGTFLFLSSIAAQIGSQTDPPYSAAKAAVLNFAQCAAKDLAPYNVRVNAICPGMIKTDLNRSVWQAWYDQQPEENRTAYDEWAEQKIRHVAPLGRWQLPEEVAALAVFLASPHANNMTGQTLNVDGGQVMHW